MSDNSPKLIPGTERLLNGGNNALGCERNLAEADAKGA
jgi:hypothetical protein